MWTENPDADALLDARVAAGWRPVPTGTVNGPEIQGHACKLNDVMDPPQR